MGYDISILALPSGFADPEYVPQVEGAPEYFRVSTAGMNLVAQAMLDAGVIDENCPDPAFDELWPFEGLTPERHGEIVVHSSGARMMSPGGPVSFDPPTQQERDAAKRLDEAMDRLLCTCSPIEGRVPLFKFCSSDGWIVTPEECKAIHAGLSRSTEKGKGLRALWTMWKGKSKEEAALIRQWTIFNRVAASCGGYRVS